MDKEKDMQQETGEEKSIEDMSVEELESKIQEAESKLDESSVAKEDLVAQQKQTEESESTSEESEIADEQKETPEKPSTVEEEVTALKEELERLKAETKEKDKRIGDKEYFIQRQANEIGELRKQLRAVIAEKTQGLQSKFEENPAQAIQDTMDIKEAQQYDEQLRQLEMQIMNQNAVKSFIPDFDQRIDDIVEVLKADGIPSTVISNFKANPYAEHYGVLINLAERAKLYKEVKAMKAELEKLKNKPQEVAEKIQKTFKQKQTITAKSGQGVAKDKANIPVNYENLSPEELDKIIKERLKEEGVL